ncbi:hypothetical protein EDD18DRAFT_1464687 [Armillaria luteobubalina]|uniref:Uncharacterized protein n=1 Tax=Armillaria luteobubalina TaxID=153913 RepID=A0AA39PZV2_9AGAR|nr:hypothetical protein EDD18DRAFT_1464687 [Armillaria luteobubalina]
MTSTLPQEIIDQIIDYNYDDIPTLQAASLASHSFLPSCRVHLFSEVVLVHEHFFDPAPGMSIIQDITGRLYTCEDFFSLLLEAPWVSSLVETLVIHNRRQVRPLNGSTRLLEDPQYAAILPSTLYSLVHVRHLVLSNAPSQSWNTLSADLRAAFLGVLPRLSQLDVDFLSFEDAADFLEVIREAKLLRHLSYVTARGVSLWELPNTINAQSPRLGLESLTVAGRPLDVAHVNMFLSPYFDLTHVRELSISSDSLFEDPESFDALQNLLDVIGDSLEHLTFGFRFYFKPMNVNKNENLRSMHIISSRVDTEKIPIPKSLESLTWDVVPQWKSDVFQAGNWEELDSFLNQPTRFLLLSRVEMIFHAEHENCGPYTCSGSNIFHGDMLEHVASQMPTLRARGILRLKERRVRHIFGRKWDRELQAI